MPPKKFNFNLIILEFSLCTVVNATSISKIKDLYICKFRGKTHKSLTNRSVFIIYELTK